MADGDIRKINPTRVSIEVDARAYVIDFGESEDVTEVIADFMAQYKQMKEREARIVAVVRLKEKREEEKAAKRVTDPLAGVSEPEIAALLKPRATRRFNFPGFEPVAAKPVVVEPGKASAAPAATAKPIAKEAAPAAA